MEKTMLLSLISGLLVFLIMQFIILYKFMLRTKLKQEREKQANLLQQQSLKPEKEEKKDKATSTEQLDSARVIEKVETEVTEEKDWFSLCIKGKHDDAIKLLEAERAKAEDTKKLSLTADIAFAYYLWKKVDKAFGILKDLVKEHPDFGDGYYNLALIYKINNMPDEAIEVLKKGLNTVTKEEERASLLLYLSSIYIQVKDKKEIEQMITTLSLLTNKTASIYTELARLHCNLNKSTEAILNYREALRLEPENLHTRNEFAKYLYDIDKIEALKEYKKVISLDHKNEEAYGMAGNIYLELELNNKALEMYEKALKINPDASWILANIGNIYKNQGFYSKAKEYLEKALKLTPNYAYGIERLGDTLKNIEEEDKKEQEKLQKKNGTETEKK